MWPSIDIGPTFYYLELTWGIEKIQESEIRNYQEIIDLLIKQQWRYYKTRGKQAEQSLP